MDNFSQRLNILGEFRDRDQERRYRLAQRASERMQVKVLWALGMLFFMLYGLFDYLGGSDRPGAMLAVAAQLLILAAGGLVLLLEPHLDSPRQRDRAYALALLVVGVAYTLVLHWRSAENVSMGGMILLVTGIYLFSPGRFLVVCTCALSCTAAAGLLLLLQGAGDTAQWMDYSYLLPANAMAAMALAQLNRVRRRGFRQQEKLQLGAEARRRVARILRRIHRQNRELLHNALPPRVARQLRAERSGALAQFHPGAVVLFADLVGFTTLSRECGPEELVEYLDELFSRFDALALDNKVDKIKTLGDAWMGVTGLEDFGEGPCGHRETAAMLSFALDMQRECSVLSPAGANPLSLRIGVHCGPLVAGVIGRQRYAFDVWGATVNIASRLQDAANPDTIMVSAGCRHATPDSFAFGEPRQLELKGCGRVEANELLGCASVPKSAGNLPGAGFRQEVRGVHG